MNFPMALYSLLQEHMAQCVFLAITLSRSELERWNLDHYYLSKATSLLATFSVTHKEEMHSIYYEYTVDHNVHQMLSMPEPLKLSYSKYIIHLKQYKRSFQVCFWSQKKIINLCLFVPMQTLCMICGSYQYIVHYQGFNHPCKILLGQVDVIKMYCARNIYMRRLPQKTTQRVQPKQSTYIQ